MSKERGNDNEKDALFVPDIVEQRIQQVDIESEMKKSFLDYSMSVIVSRALPDVRDGLKPVHRRILYTKTGLLPIRHTANVRIRSDRCWAGTIRMGMRRSMTQWCAWHRIFLCVIRWSTGMGTLVRSMVTRRLPTVIPKAG